MKAPHDLNSPSQVNTLLDHIPETLLCLCLWLVQDKSVADVVCVLHTGQLWNARQSHHGEQVDDKVGVATQDWEGPAAQPAVELKVLTVLWVEKRKGERKENRMICYLLEPQSKQHYIPLLPSHGWNLESAQKVPILAWSPKESEYTDWVYIIWLLGLTLTM